MENPLPKETIISPDTERKERVPPGQHLVTSWPTLHYGPVPHIAPKDWIFRIFGLVDRERTLSFVEFEALPRVNVFSDIHCVTTWSRLNNRWEGVPAVAIKDLVKIRPEAKYVMVHAMNDFTTNLSLEDFFQPDVLFAVNHDGERLSDAHGGPVRLVVPRLYFWKSAKWVTGVEFTATERPGFWESNGYRIHGDPWKEERFTESKFVRFFRGLAGRKEEL